jgi:hypothetical protein
VWWAVLYVAIGVVSIAVLGALALRLWRQVRDLGRTVSAASDRLNTALNDLDRASAK